MPAGRLRACDGSGMVGSSKETQFVESESFMVRDGKKEERKQYSEKVYPAFLVIITIINYCHSSLKL